MLETGKLWNNICIDHVHLPKTVLALLNKVLYKKFLESYADFNSTCHKNIVSNLYSLVLNAVWSEIEISESTDHLSVFLKLTLRK